MRIFKSFNLIKAVALSTYKEWAAYKSHMVLTVLLTPLSIFVQYSIWESVYQSQTTISGLTFEQMVLYFVVSSIIGLITFDFAEWNLQMLIRSGKLTSFLLRPINHMTFAFYQKIGHRLLSFWVEVIPVFLICTYIIKVQIPTSNLFWAIISISLSFCISFVINYSIGILAFWFTNNSGIRMAIGLISSISAGALFPLVLFPKVVQNILFVLPFQYMIYVPTRVLLGSYQLGDISVPVQTIVLFQFAALIAVYLFSKLLWKLGAKHYMGVGV